MDKTEHSFDKTLAKLFGIFYFAVLCFVLKVIHTICMHIHISNARYSSNNSHTHEECVFLCMNPLKRPDVESLLLAVGRWHV